MSTNAEPKPQLRTSVQTATRNRMQQLEHLYQQEKILQRFETFFYSFVCYF